MQIHVAMIEKKNVIDNLNHCEQIMARILDQDSIEL
jgi:hypothetical protein